MIKNLAIGGRSNRTMLLLALLLGLVCAVLVGVYLSGLESDGSSGGSGGDMVPVVVAAQDIPALTVIDESMLTIKNVAAADVLRDVYKTTADAAGKTTEVSIVAGEQVLPTKVTSAEIAQEAFGADVPASVILQQGKRAFSIQVSEVGAAGGLVRPGDHVDVLLSRPSAVDENGAEVAGAACYVLQDVPVLAVAANLTKVNADTEASAIAATTGDPSAATMTLAVSPGEAAQLATYQQGVSGTSVGKQLWVSLRPFGERGAAADMPSCTTG